MAPSSQRVDDTILDYLPDLSLTEAADGAKFINAGGEDLFWRYARLSAICLRQIDPLSRPKNSPCPCLFIARYNPQPQRHVERIGAERRPEAKLADPMLLGMAGGAQRNGIEIARFHAHTTIGSGPHMRGL